jgi:hypothetical protein
MSHPSPTYQYSLAKSTEFEGHFLSMQIPAVGNATDCYVAAIELHLTAVRACSDVREIAGTYSIKVSDRGRSGVHLTS